MNMVWAILFFVAIAIVPVVLVLAIPGVIFVIIYLLVADYRKHKKRKTLK